MSDQYSFEAIKRAAGLSSPVPAIEDIVGMTAAEQLEPQPAAFDHAAEARELLQSNAVGQAADGAWGTAIVAEAQVHATLALVEQVRRIADALTPEVSDGPF